MSGPESRVGGQLIRIGYTGTDPLGNILVEPQVFVEVGGQRAILSDRLLDLIGFYRRRRADVTVDAQGDVVLPDGFEEAKRAAIEARP